MNGNEKTSLSWPVSVYESCDGVFIADSTKKYTLLRANNLKEGEWLKNREKEREESRKRERDKEKDIYYFNVWAVWLKYILWGRKTFVNSQS